MRNKVESKTKQKPDSTAFNIANNEIMSMYKKREEEAKNEKLKYYKRKLIIKKFEDFERKRIIERDNLVDEFEDFRWKDKKPIVEEPKKTDPYEDLTQEEKEAIEIEKLMNPKLPNISLQLYEKNKEEEKERERQAAIIASLEESYKPKLIERELYRDNIEALVKRMREKDYFELVQEEYDRYMKKLSDEIDGKELAVKRINFSNKEYNIRFDGVLTSELNRIQQIRHAVDDFKKFERKKRLRNALSQDFNVEDNLFEIIQSKKDTKTKQMDRIKILEDNLKKQIDFKVDNKSNNLQPEKIEMDSVLLGEFLHPDFQAHSEKQTKDILDKIDHYNQESNNTLAGIELLLKNHKIKKRIKRYVDIRE